MKKLILIVFVLGIVLAQPSAAFLDDILDDIVKGIRDAVNEVVEAAQKAGGLFPEAIARIKSAITFEDENIEQFLSGPAKTGKAIAIVKSSDKVITAVKQNPKLNNGAIALVRYKNLERLNVCEKIGQLKEQTKQEMNCDYSRDKKMHVIKMDVANDLWLSMTQKLQLH